MLRLKNTKIINMMIYTLYTLYNFKYECSPRIECFGRFPCLIYPVIISLWVDEARSIFSINKKKNTKNATSTVQPRNCRADTRRRALPCWDGHRRGHDQAFPEGKRRVVVRAPIRHDLHVFAHGGDSHVFYGSTRRYEPGQRVVRGYQHLRSGCSDRERSSGGVPSERIQYILNVNKKKGIDS